MRFKLLYSLLTLTMAIWGFNLIAIKVLVTNFPTLTITSLRVFVAFMSILPFLLLRKSKTKMTRKDSLYLVGISLTTILGHQFFMSVGLSHTTAVNGAVILGSVPIVTTVAAAIFLKEDFNLHKVIGAFLGFIGVIIIIFSGSTSEFQFFLGDILFCCTVVSQAIGFIFVKKISNNLDSLVITGISQFLGGIFLITVSTIYEPNGFFELSYVDWKLWLLLLFSGVIATGAGHFLYNISIRDIGASKSAVFLNLTPFFSIVGANIFLKEKILMGHWIGFFIVVAGVLFGTEFLKTTFRKKGVSVSDVN